VKLDRVGAWQADGVISYDSESSRVRSKHEHEGSSMANVSPVSLSLHPKPGEKRLDVGGALGDFGPPLASGSS